MKTSLIVVIVLLGWKEAVGYTDKNGRPCGCNRMHDPVCGDDNVDYPNPDCASRCGNVSGYKRGTCARPALCGCPPIYLPVCARRPNGVLDTFDNGCNARCNAGAEVVSEGSCGSSVKLAKKEQPPCICTMDYRPVCGLKNGKWTTYGNACSATCAKVEGTKNGACGRQRGGCPCGRIYSPVCARLPDGSLRSFSNLCEAQCEEGTKQYDGNCAASPDNSLPGGHYKVKRGRDCVCTREFNPVCALHSGQWKTHSNPCMASCDGRPEEIKRGRCERASQLPVIPDSKLRLQQRSVYHDSDLRPQQLPVFPDSDLRPQQLPVFPDSDLRPQQLPVFPDSDLRPQQLPVFPDSDLGPQQLPVFPDSDSEDSDEDLIASQLPYLPKLLKQMFQ